MFVLPVEQHDAIVKAAYKQRGFTEEEATDAARLASLASWHGIRTHNAIKALHLDDMFGSKSTGCIPGAEIEIIEEKRFSAVQRWNANKKLGQTVAFRAMEKCMEMAEKHGVGIVMVDNAFHYLWGGGYVLEAAKRGFIAYTNCTSALAEVVPFGGSHPTLGTNPHSWAFPTHNEVGFPIIIDWATSTVAMGRVQQLLREGKSLPPGAAVDTEGKETTDPSKVSALLPFGAHKGYGMSLLDELYAAYGGGSLPTIRGRPDKASEGEKTSTCFFFQCIHPDALNCGQFAKGQSQADNVKSVLKDVMGHGNKERGAMFPGELESSSAKQSKEAGGLLFTEAEIDAFQDIAKEVGQPLDIGKLKQL